MKSERHSPDQVIKKLAEGDKLLNERTPQIGLGADDLGAEQE